MDIGQILQNIGFEWQVALANLVNFLIIFYLLKRFAFKPIKEIVEKRKDKIDEGLENAKKAERDLIMAREKAEDIEKEARQNASTILKETHIQVEEKFKKAEEEAEIKKEEIIESGHKALELERRQAESEIKRESAEMIIRGVEKIIEDEFTTEKQEQLIKNFKA